VVPGPLRRLRRLSLKWRLSLSFVGITILTVAVVAAVLIPLLSRHYAGAQETYLEAAAERAVRDLSTLSWKKESSELAAQVSSLALVTQARVKVTDPSGGLLADSGSPQVAGTGDSNPSAPTTDTSQGQSVQPAGVVQRPVATPLPSPFGGGLFGGSPSGSSLPRSDARIERPVERNGRLLGYVEVSEAPAYGEAALLNVTRALELAGVLAVLFAGIVGWLVSSRLSSPIQKLTRASDRMARGDLRVRSDIDRGDEVGRLADSFNSMADRVEETVASRQRFVADAAHEFGTPLTALQANLELAQSRAQSAEERRLIDASLAEARRLEHLSTGLLRLSRLESRDLPQEKQLVDLAEMVRHLGDAVGSRAEQKEIDLRLDVPEGEVVVPAYRDKLEVAVGNLLDNALKFTPSGGTVTLGLRKEEGRAVIWVEDTGIGMSSEEMAKLFERFHRGHNAADYPGSGLGLAIVRATMDVHGGSVAVTSDAHGSRFELTLPTAPAPFFEA
jgi:signal transduction histidine kinase